MEGLSRPRAFARRHGSLAGCSTGRRTTPASRNPIRLVAAVTLVLCAGSGTACRSFLGIRSASKAEREKIAQPVGPFDERGVSLRVALQTFVNGARLRVPIDACPALLDRPVTIVTPGPQSLESVVRDAAMQVGASVRMFVGEHGELARPSLSCPQPGETSTAIEWGGS